MLTLTMESFINALYEGIFEFPIRIVHSYWNDTIESDYIIGGDNDIDMDRLEKALKVIVDGYLYKGTYDASAPVYLKRGDKMLEASSPAWLFSTTPLLDSKRKIMFTIEAVDNDNYPRLSGDIYDIVDYINSVIEYHEVDPEDIIALLVRDVADGVNTERGYIEPSWANVDFILDYAVI